MLPPPVQDKDCSAFHTTELGKSSQYSISATSSKGILAESSSVNIIQTRPRRDPQEEAHLNRTAASTDSSLHRNSSLTHKRSVRSISRQYETRTSQSEAHSEAPTSRSPSPSVISTSASPSSAPLDVPLKHRSTSPASSGPNTFLLPPSLSLPLDSSSAHGRRSSLLLATGTYPSTLISTPPRSRTLSGSSASSYSGPVTRSPAIRLASGSYPSTLQPPSRKTSSSSLSSLRSPPPIPVPDNMPSSTGNDAPEVSQPRTHADSNFQLRQEDDEGLYEALDDLGDLSHASTVPVAVEGAELDLSKMSAAERREHSRKHSQIHSRNLSVFFPRPGTDAETAADEARIREMFERNDTQDLQLDAVPQARRLTEASTSKKANAREATTSNVHRRNGSGNRPHITVSTDNGTLSPRTAQAQFIATDKDHTSFGSSQDHSNLSPSPTKSRRGHHHRHSVAMLDSALSPAIAGSYGGATMTKSVSASSFLSDASANASLNGTSDAFASPDSSFDRNVNAYAHAHDNLGKRSLHARTVSALGHIPQTSRPLLLFGISHFGLGAALWVAGQEVDSLAATGLGYLVVFDAMGILSNAISDWATEWEQHASDLRRRTGKSDGISLRRPYGTHRVSTLLHFVQVIYLLFSSVYVLKESVEHALLEGGGGVMADAGESASGHEHSHAHTEHTNGLMMPNLLLALSLAACVFSNMVMGNHAKLVAACGISTAAAGGAGSGAAARGGHERRGSVLMQPSALASPLLALLANPFSLTVLFFSATLLFAGLTMHPLQVAALDKVLAGLESVSMFYIAYPASVALGKVLLQTAPSDMSPAKQQLMRALKMVEEHELVSYVPPPNLWQLTPPTSSLTQAGGSGVLGGNISGGRRGGGIHFGSKSASLIASVTVYLKPQATDEDCFQMTRWVWERLAPSVGAGRGLLAGEMLRGSLRAGELTVSVKREGHEEDGFHTHESCSHGDEHRHGDHDHQHHHHHHRHSDREHSGHDHGHDHSHENGSHHTHNISEHGNAHSHTHSHTKDTPTLASSRHNDHDQSHHHSHGHRHTHNH